MSDPLGPPGCPYDPGAEAVDDPIAVRTVTLHRTIGTWPGDYSVGKNRTHNQGTFQHLIGQDVGQWVQFYPANNYASHAYGANDAGPGVEISGQNGEPLTDWQIDALGQVLRWYRDEWGIMPTIRIGEPREYADQDGPLGFITHSHVYSPLAQYTHYDFITEDEFNRALGSDQTPPPEPQKRYPKMIIVNTDEKGFFTYTPELGHFQPIDAPTALYLMGTGAPNVKVSWATCLEWADGAEKRIKALKA